MKFDYVVIIAGTSSFASGIIYDIICGQTNLLNHFSFSFINGVIITATICMIEKIWRA